MIRHISEILQERENERVDEKQWVLNEAMNQRNIRHGGTFSNVLARKLDQIVTPIFAEILSKIDEYCNLNLINPKNKNTALSHIWLEIFRNSQIMQFRYKDMIVPRDLIPGFGKRKAGGNFVCLFPFSWLVFDAVNSHWDNTKRTAGK